MQATRPTRPSRPNRTSLPEAVRQKLMEIKGKINQVVGSSRDEPSHGSHGSHGGRATPLKRAASAGPRPGAVTPPPPSRPHTASSTRSAQARELGRPASAQYIPRPQSARPQSARPQSARPRVEVQEPKLHTDFQGLLELIGAKAAARFSSMQQCFRMLDLDHNGRVEIGEIKELLRIFHLPEEAADQFFCYLDPEKTGSLDFQVVADVIGQFIKPGYRNSVVHRSPAPQADEDGTSKVLPRFAHVQVTGGEVDLKQLAEIVGSKARAKFANTRNVFRGLDEARNGFVTRPECIRFMETYGYPSCVGEQAYNTLLHEGQHQVDFSTFVRFFGPYIHPRFEELAQQHEKRHPAPAAPVARAATPASARSVSRRPPTPGPGRARSARSAASARRASEARPVAGQPPQSPLKVEGSTVAKENERYEYFSDAGSTSAGASAGSCLSSVPSTGASTERLMRRSVPAPRGGRLLGDGINRALSRSVVWNGNNSHAVLQQKARPKSPRDPPGPPAHVQSTQIRGPPRPPSSRRPHTAKARLDAQWQASEDLKKSASGHCLHCGRNDQGQMSAEYLCDNMSHHWGVIA
ncbi:unnamed protein product [Effrenium voratum]|uniref:EF-hand domain-containing protein n=1 Tax=Effrenium voratum TaxID=2562239 RepID=A0AA36JJW2_9DINO|nr:unnamed protein product [Effrenium voratum]CAJ1455439.1 unnamed protein product [Effrenium voratum]